MRPAAIIMEPSVELLQLQFGLADPATEQEVDDAKCRYREYMERASTYMETIGIDGIWLKQGESPPWEKVTP